MKDYATHLRRLGTLALLAALPGCVLAAVAVGAAAGAGAVIYTAEDTVECELELMPEDALRLAETVVREMGSLGETSTWEENAQIRRRVKGIIGSTEVSIQIVPGAARSKVSVKGRSGLFADRKTAEAVLERMRKRSAG